MKNNALYELISSLTKSEKRYIQLTISNQEGEKSYLKLFNYLESAKKYDPDKIKKHFKNESFVNYLSRIQNYLYALVLKSMRSYHAERSLKNRMNGYLADIDFLYYKKLYDSCEKLITKAEKIIEMARLFDYKLLLDSYRLSIIREKSFNNISKKNIDDIFLSQRNYLDFRKNLTKYIQYQDKVLQLLSKGTFSSAFSKDYKELNTLIKEIEKNAEGANEPESERSLNVSLYLAYLLKNDPDKTLLYSKKAFNSYMNNPVMIKAAPKNFIKMASNFLGALLLKKEGKIFENTIEDIKTTLKIFRDKQFDELEHYAIFRIYLHQLNYYSHTHSFQKGKIICDQIKSYISNGELSLANPVYLPILGNMSTFYFVYEKYDEALNWFNKIVVAKDNIIENIVLTARVFLIITHFELGHFRILPYLITSLIRLLSRQEQLHDFEKTLLKSLKKISENKFTYEQSDMKELRNELFTLIEASSHQEISIIIGWLDSKITGKKLSEILLEKYLK